MTVERSNAKKELYINDLGVTMRTMLAVAANGHSECANRKWHIVYKGIRIGMVQVSDRSTNPAQPRC